MINKKVNEKINYANALPIFSTNVSFVLPMLQSTHPGRNMPETITRISPESCRATIPTGLKWVNRPSGHSGGSAVQHARKNSHDPQIASRHRRPTLSPWPSPRTWLRLRAHLSSKRPTGSVLTSPQAHHTRSTCRVSQTKPRRILARAHPRTHLLAPL